MANLFHQLLISSPNSGGLFLIKNKKVLPLDNIDTTGINKTNNVFLRAQQPASLWINRKKSTATINNTLEYDDIHDVLCHGKNIYIVGTSKNEIIKLDQKGKEVKKWVFDGENDSYHINCLAIWNKRVVFSAFGDFKKTYEYKGNTVGNGYVQDLLSGRRLITGLSQPHSLTPYGKNLLIANSEKMEIREYSPSGKNIRTLQLNGYTRGIFVSDETIYIGLSSSRNIGNQGSKKATIIALDNKSWREKERISLPAKEIYSIISITDTSELIDIISNITKYSSERNSSHISHLKDKLNKENAHVCALTRSLNDKHNKICSLKKSTGEHIAQTKLLINTVNERDLQITNLNITKNEHNDKIDTLNKTLSERDEHITKLNNTLYNRDALISKLNNKENEYNNKIDILNKTISDRDALIIKFNNKKNEYNDKVGEINKALSERDALIANLNNKENEYNNKIGILNKTISDRDALIIKLNNKKNEYNNKIGILNKTISDRDALISRINNTENEQSDEIEKLNKVLSKYNTQISNLKKHETQLNLSLISSNEQIEILNKNLKEKNNSIKNLEDTITEANKKTDEIRISEEKKTEFINQSKSSYHAHITDLEKAVFNNQVIIDILRMDLKNKDSEMNSFLNSNSWKATAALRYIANKYKNLVKHIKHNIFILLKTIYKKLPLKIKYKTQLKRLFFRAFSFALKNTTTYKQWLECEKSTISNYNLNHVHSYTPKENKHESSAGEKLEWNEYMDLYTEIKNIKEEKTKNFNPKELPIINISNNNPLESCASISFSKPTINTIVSIIIPVYNNIKLTLECLLSISKFSKNINYEIIIADDASNDDTKNILKKIPNITLFTNEKNLGFLRNCNKALKYVSGEYVVFLNNDVQVTDGWLEALLKTFTENDNVGAVGPLIVYPSGHLQEAGVSFSANGSSKMIGLNEDPNQVRFNYTRRVDYVSGACLMLPTKLLQEVGGFSEDFLPCYCEDSDLCLKIQSKGYYIYNNPAAKIIHHLSKTTASLNNKFKYQCITKNTVTLSNKWNSKINQLSSIRYIAFYLPQFHPIAENNEWWGDGFTEWTNVTKAKPNFEGHYQPHVPADLGYYDLLDNTVLKHQAELAKRYNIEGFCFYYYWFAGKRLLETPIENLLKNKDIQLPFCLCWANENWTRRWDGQDNEVLIAQEHSPDDDQAVIQDLIRYFKDSRYIQINGKPLILVYRVTLFPDFKKTAHRWRTACHLNGIGEIYIAMVESFDLVHSEFHPSKFGCDAAVEFPPQGMAEQKPPSGEVLNPDFDGSVANYRDIAINYATRETPNYTRFRGVMPGWDNTARRQNNSFCFEQSTPGAFQAWVETVAEETREQQHGDEQIIFINAWNEWAEGAHLEPDIKYGHAYLEAIKNSIDAPKLLLQNKINLF